MRMMWRQHINLTSLIVSAAALLSAAAGALAQPWEYAIFRPAGDDYPSSTGRAMNEHGWIAGVAGFGNAFGWAEPGPIDILPGLHGYHIFERPWGMNNHGWIAGRADDSSGLAHPVLWRDGLVVDLLPTGWIAGSAEDVNDGGSVVGGASLDLGGGRFSLNQALAWVDGDAVVLPTFSGLDGSSTATAINERGSIAGVATRPDRVQSAVIWRNGLIFELPALAPDTGAKAFGINDLDQVVGEVSDGGDYLACVWDRGRLHVIHEIGRGSSAYGINNAGEVVGFADIATYPYDFEFIGFRWRLEEGAIDLNERMPPRNEYIFQGGEDINDAGQIVGYALPKSSSLAHAVLLTPVHPSMTLTPTGGALVAGRMNELVIRGATPGKRVYFAYAEQGGGSYIPGCTLQENALQLESPKTLGSAVADADGVARLQRYIPRPALGETLLLQAVVPGECAVSELIVETIE